MRAEEYQDETVRFLCAYLRSYHSKDDPVIESAVLESLRNHYAKDARPSWSDHRLDLHGATIGNPFDFDGCGFNETVNLDGATFEQDFRLADCSFEKLTTRGTIFRQDPQISDPIINESWDIRLSGSSAEKLTITRGIIGKIRIFDASCPLSFDACTVKSIDIQEQGTINSINAGRGGTIESINAHNGTIKLINAGRYGTIGSIGVDGGVFDSIGVGPGTIGSIDIQELGTIKSIKIQEHGHVPSIETCGGIGSLMIYGGGFVDELEMTGGVIHAFYPSANNGIKKLDLSGGRVALLIKPQDFEPGVQNQNRVIETVSLMTAITAPVPGSA